MPIVVKEIQINDGTTFPEILYGSATLNFASTLANAVRTLTVSVPGAQVGDVVELGIPPEAMPADGGYRAWVSAADTVSIRFWNNGSVSRDPGSGTFNVMVLK